MKIQLASDLHLEFLAKRFPGERLITPHPEADVLVIAGDITSGADAVDLFSDWPVPVIAVAGNHEFYGYDYDDVVHSLRKSAAGTNVHFLERDQFDIGEVRFLGCCLWTDYELNLAPDASRPLAMQRASYELYDHTAIRRGSTRFSPDMALNEHQLSRDWLRAQLEEPWRGPTVVVTHHGVHPLSVHPRYADDITSAAFVSDLGPLLDRADLWLHGHVHDSFDYRVSKTRVVANPRGYARNFNGAANRASALVFENSAFDPLCLIEVAS